MERRNQIVEASTGTHDRIAIKRKVGYDGVEDDIQLPVTKQMETMQL
jgi:hypothetical protein